MLGFYMNASVYNCFYTYTYVCTYMVTVNGLLVMKRQKAAWLRNTALCTAVHRTPREAKACSVS